VPDATCNSHQTAGPVLVTGGSGFLGRALVIRLLERGCPVRTLARGPDEALQEMGVRQFVGDLAHGEIVEAACRGAATVFHTAAKPPPWGRYRDYHRTNVVGTQNVLAACRKHAVEALVHTSSPSVVFNGRDLRGVDESIAYPARHAAHYSRTKAQAEQSVLKASAGGLPAIVLRPHQIWGPQDPHFVPRLIARAKRLKQIGDGTNLVDTTYIDNAVDAHLLAADALKANPGLSGRIYFISQGEPIRAWEMINMILRAAGLPPVRGRMSYRTAWGLGAVAEWTYRILALPGEPPMTRFLAAAVARSHWFDISAARRDLGYAPRIDINEGMRRLAHWLSVGSAQANTP
jgi:nucleoside-diphosphate-sugar epimerase